jgi:cytochrome c2
MYTALISYNKRNKIAKNLMDVLERTKGVKIKYDLDLEEAIEDVKQGRITTYENFEEYQKEMRKKLGYV